MPDGYDLALEARFGVALAHLFGRRNVQCRLHEFGAQVWLRSLHEAEALVAVLEAAAAESPQRVPRPEPRRDSGVWEKKPANKR